MVSIDKDMQTIPGRLYNPNKSDLGTRTISVDDAGLFWVKQALTGDQIDHYTGFPGIGHKLADEIFMPIHEANLDETPEVHLAALWDAVNTAYPTRIPRSGDKPLTVKDAVIQARLARTLRYGDYNPKTKEVKQWKS